MALLFSSGAREIGERGDERRGRGDKGDDGTDVSLADESGM